MATNLQTSSMLRTDPRLILLQSRLFAPNYVGPGRWVIFHPETRRSFLAVGGAKHSGEVDRTSAVPRVGGREDTWPSWMDGVQHQDIVPDVVRVLMAASAEGQTPERMEQDGLISSSERVTRLVNSGLLHDGWQVNSSKENDDFLSLYQLSNVDYPFNDYFDPEWFRKDAATMERYLEASSQPPLLTPREGPSFPLPSVALADGLGGSSSGFSLPVLARILKWSVAPTGEIDLPVVGPLLRKTSPSGGARHPTEIVVLLGEPLGEVPSGAYFYDAAQHCLVAIPVSAAKWLPEVDGPCALVICSRVERAMWRYRELRALRPVILDAGHVAETVSLLAGIHGVSSALSSPSMTSTGAASWMDDVPFALVILGGAEIRRKIPPRPPDAEPDAGAVLTNPAMFLRFRDGRAEAVTAWPRIETHPVDVDDLQVLSHCLPSGRGDRDTTESGVADSFPNWDLDRRRSMLSAGIFLPRATAYGLYERLKRWAGYGWYLSALAHLQVMSSVDSKWHDGRQDRGDVRRLDTTDGRELGPLLLSRRTTRAFSGRPIPRESLDSVLRTALEVDGVGDPSVFVASIAVEGLEPHSVHRWTSRDGLTVMPKVSLGPEDVRAMTIGQEPISRAAAVVWLVAQNVVNRPADYEISIMNLGRLGQRICLAAEATGLGVFLTPAVSDSRTLEALSVEDRTTAVTYAFGIGHSGRRP